MKLEMQEVEYVVLPDNQDRINSTLYIITGHSARLSPRFLWPRIRLAVTSVRQAHQPSRVPNKLLIQSTFSVFAPITK